MLVPCTRKAWATKVIRKKQKSTATERSWRNSQHRAQDAPAGAARGAGPGLADAGGASASAGPGLSRARAPGLEGHRFAPFTTRVPAIRSCSPLPPNATIRKPMPRLAAESR